MALLGWGIVMVFIFIASAVFIVGGCVCHAFSGWDGEAKIMFFLGGLSLVVMCYWITLRPFEILIK